MDHPPKKPKVSAYPADLLKTLLPVLEIFDFLSKNAEIFRAGEFCPERAARIANSRARYSEPTSVKQPHRGRIFKGTPVPLNDSLFHISLVGKRNMAAGGAVESYE